MMPTSIIEERPEAPGAKLVRAHAIAKRFGGRAVLAHVDLSVAKREIVTLIGPNGSGKTTLLRILLGLVPADAGEVRLHPGMRIGYAPQHLNADPILPLPVRRFLELGQKASSARLREALEEVGAAHVEHSPLHAISGGELRRVALARALLREPELLVLDEPVQGVDVAGQRDIYRLIVSIRDRRGCGVLMVSHDLHLVMAATDTVVCLNTHVCCTGRPEAVSRHPAYLALFGPVASEGLAVYTHRHDHVHDSSGHAVALPEIEREGRERPGRESGEGDRDG